MIKFLSGMVFGLLLGIAFNSFAATIIGNTPTLTGWTVTANGQTVCSDPEVDFNDKEIECNVGDPRDMDRVDPR